MIEDWEVPERYWLVDTTDSRFSVSDEEKARIYAAQDHRDSHVDIVDITGSEARITIRDIHAIYLSTPEIRRKNIMISEAFNITERATRGTYRKTHGIFDED